LSQLGRLRWQLRKAFKVGQPETRRRIDLEHESARWHNKAFRPGKQGEGEGRRADESFQVAWKMRGREK
jgi:hypothetical protein